MVSKGEKVFLGVAAAAAFVGYKTYGERWDFTRNEKGSINGVELLHNEQKPPRIEATVDTSTIVVPVKIEDKTGVKAALISSALENPWCSDAYVSVLAEDVEGESAPSDPKQVVNAQVCIDADTLEVRDGYVVAYFGTNPKLKTGDGHPSLFLTYQQEVLVEQCKDAKENMRQKLQSSLVQVLGGAAAGIQTEIHVDMQNLRHPCDDLFIEP